MISLKRRNALCYLLSGLVLLSIISGFYKTVFAKETDRKRETDNGFDVNAVFCEVASPLEGFFMEHLVSHGNGASYDEPNIFSVFSVGKRYYVFCEYYSNEMWTKSLLSFDENGTDLQEIKIPYHDDEGERWDNYYLTSLNVTKDGKIILSWNEYEDEPFDTPSTLKMACIDMEGREIWSLEAEGEATSYTRGMVSADDATVLLTESDVHIFRNDDGAVKKVELPGEHFYGDICLGGDGSVLLINDLNDELEAWKLDTMNGTYEKQKTTSDDFYNDYVASGKENYDFFCSAKKTGIYGFRLGTPEPSLFIDFIASGLFISDLKDYAVMSEESALIVYHGTEGWGDFKFRILKKADPEKAPEIKVLTLGCTDWGANNLWEEVDYFNKTNSEYRIRVISYPYKSQYTHITAGDVPDMICVNSEMLLQRYVSMGIIEEIGDRFANDWKISGNEYLMNVINAFKLGGKMYFTVPGFTVVGMIGKKSDFQNTKGLTISQLEKLISRKKIGYDTALGFASHEDLYSWMTYAAMKQYVNLNNDTCSFDSDSFVNLLEFAGKCTKIYRDDFDQWEEADGWIRKGKQLIKAFCFDDFTDYMRERYGYFDQEINLMGVLGDVGNGPAIKSKGPMIAMSHSALDKDACWKFMRSFYLERYQESMQENINLFPISKRALKDKASRAMEMNVNTYLDEDGREITEIRHDSVYIDGKKIEIPLISQSDIDVVMSMLESIDTVLNDNEIIEWIIEEESAAYFQGEKSAREAADCIQTRVNAYYEERD